MGSISLISPEGLPKGEFHRQVSVATGSKLVFMAGQVAVDADGALVGASRSCFDDRRSGRARLVPTAIMVVVQSSYQP
jgi:hypothetical protein